jgi:hypothetical protein
LPRLSDPIGAARDVGRHGNDCVISLGNDGGQHYDVKPLDVMREICEVILEINDAEEYLDAESEQVLNEIIEVSDRMSDDMYSVAGEVESVARLIAMQKKMERDKVGLDSETMCRFDYAWDWVGGGIAERLRQKNLAGWLGFPQIYSIHATRRRMVTAPQDTRARVRGEVIGAHLGNNCSLWGEIDFGREHGTYVHPLDATSGI